MPRYAYRSYAKSGSDTRSDPASKIVFTSKQKVRRKAKYRTPCDICRGPIEPGEWISPSREKKWRHADAAVCREKRSS